MPSPFSPTKLTTHSPFSLLFFSLFFLFSLPPLSSSDGDLSHLHHRCRRRPKIRISSSSTQLAPPSISFSMASSSVHRRPLLSDFDRYLSGSSTVRVLLSPWPDPQPSTASLSFLLFLFLSTATLDLPRLPSSSIAAFLSPFPLCFLSTSTAYLPDPAFLLPVLVADVVADHQRPLLFSP